MFRFVSLVFRFFVWSRYLLMRGEVFLQRRPRIGFLGLRCYGIEGSIGLDWMGEAYINPTPHTTARIPPRRAMVSVKAATNCCIG